MKATESIRRLIRQLKTPWGIATIIVSGVLTVFGVIQLIDYLAPDIRVEINSTLVRPGEDKLPLRVANEGNFAAGDIRLSCLALELITVSGQSFYGSYAPFTTPVGLEAGERMTMECNLHPSIPVGTIASAEIKIVWKHDWLLWESGGSTLKQQDLTHTDLQTWIDRPAERGFSLSLPIDQPSTAENPSAFRAWNLVEAGRIEEAISELAGELDLVAGVYGRNSIRTVNLLQDLAYVYTLKGLDETATDTARDNARQAAVKLLERAQFIIASSGPEPIEALLISMRLGIAYTETEDFDAARAQLLAAMELAGECCGNPNPYTGLVLSNMGELFHRGGRFVESELYFSRAVDAYIRADVQGSPNHLAAAEGLLHVQTEHLNNTRTHP
jgi:hypothetical protein